MATVLPAAEELAGLIGPQALAVDSVAAAYEAAVNEAGEDGVVCVCGSLYLVGSFKEMLAQTKAGCHWRPAASDQYTKVEKYIYGCCF